MAYLGNAMTLSALKAGFAENTRNKVALVDVCMDLEGAQCIITC